MTDGRSVLPLFIPVRPEPGENLMSMMVRACDANVLGRLAQFQAIVETRKSRVEYLPFTGFEDAHVIAELLGVHLDVVVGRMHATWAHSSADDYIDWYGTPLPRRYVETRTMRFSPTGLASGEHHRAVWSIKPLKYCATSMEALVGACGMCGRETSWVTTKSTTRCSACNYPFSVTPTEGVRAELQHDARRVACLVSPDGAIRADALSLLPAPFNSWEAGDVFHAVVELGFIANNPIQVPGCTRWKSMTRGSFKEYSIDDLVSGYRFVRDWPRSLDLHLTKLINGRSGNTRALMGSMGKYFDQAASKTPLRELIRFDAPTALRKIDAPVRGNQVGGGVLARSAGTLTATEAADHFKVDKKVIARLSASTSCCIAKSTLRCGVVLYNRARVEAALKAWRGSIAFDQAARVLGVPPYCTEAFIQAGLLVEVSDADALLLSDGVRLVSRKSLDVLAQRLEEQPLGHADGLDSVPFLSGMTNVLHPDSWAAAVQQILNGEIQLTGFRERAGPLLNRFLVVEQELAKLKDDDDRLPIPDVNVSGVVAADILGVSNTLVSGAVRLGLVHGKKTSRRIDVPLSEVRRYRREFIGAEEVTKKTGVRSQDFSSSMRSHGFEPLGQAYNTYLWRRADARVLYPSQLTEIVGSPSHQR